MLTWHEFHQQIRQLDMATVGISATTLLALLVFLLVSVLSLGRKAHAFRPPFSFRATKRSTGDASSSTTSSTPSAPILEKQQRTLRQILQWWTDDWLATDDTCDETKYELLEPDYTANVTHFCFLLHGHRGLSRDLSYLQSRMRSVAKTELSKRKEVLINGQGGQALLTHDVMVHSSTANEKKTTDGVRQGGERLVEEMLSVIRQEMERRSNHSDVERIVTVSVLGNSLGGIYGRYAIARLAQICGNPDNSTYTLDGRYQLHFNTFCTTATPHLGIASHTFLPIPRTAEITVAHAMGETGRDLFRLNDLLLTMATDDEFLRPLSRFHRRIAYANAYGTDFPVPVHTAAFLSESSEYPHHFLADGQEKDVVVDDNGLVIATLHTQPRAEAEDSSEHLNAEEDDDDKDLAVMSANLDALGWKKVFVDVRKEIPKIAIPKLNIRRNNGGSNHGSNDSDTSENEEKVEPITLLRERGVVGSKDVAAAVTKPLFDDEFHWPMGHNMMVAFSRSKLSSYMNKAGRPLVDALAKELVDDILAWSAPEWPR